MTTEPGLPTLFHQAGKLRLLTPIEEVELAGRRDAGDADAVKKLVEHNIRLSIWRAKKWQDRGVPYEDLIQEGVFGLERAARKFDPSKRVRFSTYATTWIDHFMQRAVGQEDFVPYIVRRRRQKAYELKDAGFTVEQISEKLGCSVVDVVEALESTDILKSLDGDEVTLYDKLAAPDDGVDPEVRRVREAIATLPHDEAEYMSLRHGLGEYAPHTKSEAAASMGITSRQAGTLESRATDALREALADYSREPSMRTCIGLEPEEVGVVCSR